MGFGDTHAILDMQNPQIKGSEPKGTVARMCRKVGLGSCMFSAVPQRTEHSQLPPALVLQHVGTTAIRTGQIVQFDVRSRNMQGTRLSDTISW